MANLDSPNLALSSVPGLWRGPRLSPDPCLDAARPPRVVETHQGPDAPRSLSGLWEELPGGGPEPVSSTSLEASSRAAAPWNRGARVGSSGQEGGARGE